MLERASARETAARVAAGAVARQMLQRARHRRRQSRDRHRRRRRCPTIRRSPFERMRAIPDGFAAALRRSGGRGGDDRGDRSRARGRRHARRQLRGDRARRAAPASARTTQWDRKLDGRLAQALMSIPAIKAVGIGFGVAAARRPGSRVHDEIVARPTVARQASRRSRGRPIAPAASKAASPTAKSSASRVT